MFLVFTVLPFNYHQHHVSNWEPCHFECYLVLTTTFAHFFLPGFFSLIYLFSLQVDHSSSPSSLPSLPPPHLPQVQVSSEKGKIYTSLSVSTGLAYQVSSRLSVSSSTEERQGSLARPKRSKSRQQSLSQGQLHLDCSETHMKIKFASATYLCNEPRSSACLLFG